MWLFLEARPAPTYRLVGPGIRAPEGKAIMSDTTEA